MIRHRRVLNHLRSSPHTQLLLKTMLILKRRPNSYLVDVTTTATARSCVPFTTMVCGRSSFCCLVFRRWHPRCRAFASRTWSSQNYSCLHHSMLITSNHTSLDRGKLQLLSLVHPRSTSSPLDRLHSVLRQVSLHIRQLASNSLSPLSSLHLRTPDPPPRRRRIRARQMNIHPLLRAMIPTSTSHHP